MKKHLLILPLLLISISVIAFNKQIQNWFRGTKAVKKEISFSITGKNDYTLQAYNDAVAEIQISITKISGNKKVVLWKKEFGNMLLKQYNSDKIPIENVNINNTFYAKEMIEVSYTITYKSNGKVLKLGRNIMLDKAASKDKLEIEV